MTTGLFITCPFGMGFFAFKMNIYSIKSGLLTGSLSVTWNARAKKLLFVYSILFYPITLEGRRDTTDEFATIPFHFVLFSAALVELTKSIPVHSLILSSHLFFCLPLFLFPFTVPCWIIFANREDLETWPNYLSFRFLTRVRSSSYSPMTAWIFLRTSSLVTWSMLKCSIASGSTSSQKPAFFSLTLQSRSMIHRHTEIWKWQGSASASPLIQEICCYLSKRASAL